MNFHNPAFDGQRGITDSTPGGDPGKYREYLPAADLTTLDHAGQHHAGRHHAPHTAGNTASREPSGCTRRPAPPTTTPTRAASSTPSKSKVLGYTIEWGPQRATIPKSFHPDYPHMVPDHRGDHRRAARVLLRAGRQARHPCAGPGGSQGHVIVGTPPRRRRPPMSPLICRSPTPCHMCSRVSPHPRCARVTWPRSAAGDFLRAGVTRMPWTPPMVRAGLLGARTRLCRLMTSGD